MLRYWTAGESHGKALVALVDGFPAGLEIDSQVINRELARRQGGYGRGGRQRLETDQVDILSGLWHGKTLGSPLALMVVNKDYKIERMEDLESPRPGHGDLCGSLKHLSSIRAILERASARETTVRVAAGALARQLLAQFGIVPFAYVVSIGPVDLPPTPGTLAQQQALRDASPLYSLNPQQDEEAKRLIDACQKQGDTLGGIIEIRVEGLPFGLGTHAQWDRKLDGRIAPSRDGGPGDQGGGNRFGIRGRPSSRLRRPRSHPVRSIAGRYAHAWFLFGRGTMPADWRPGSRTPSRW